MTRGAEVLNTMWEKLKAERNEVVNEENFFWIKKAIEALEFQEEDKKIQAYREHWADKGY